MSALDQSSIQLLARLIFGVHVSDEKVRIAKLEVVMMVLLLAVSLMSSGATCWVISSSYGSVHIIAILASLLPSLYFFLKALDSYSNYKCMLSYCDSTS